MSPVPPRTTPRTTRLPAYGALRTVRWVLTACLFSTALFAQKALSPPAAKFRALLAEALRNNPEIVAARREWLAEIAAAEAAGTLPDPRISLGQFVEPVETRVGPQRRRYGVKQTLPWPGKLALQRERAQAGAGAALARFRRVRLDVFARFCRAYARYYAAGRSLDITRQTRTLLVNLQNVARARYRAGGSLGPLSQIQVEVVRMDDRIASLQDALTPLRAELNALLNRASNAPIEVPAQLPDDFPPPLDPESVRALVAVQNPELEELRALVQGQDASADLARKRGLPDFTIGLTYIETDSARMPGVDDSGKDPLMFSVSLNLPLWRDAYAADLRAALGRRSALSRRIEATEDRIQAQLAMAAFEYRDARRRIALYRDSLLPKARETMQVTQRAFEAGKADFLNLIDSERTLLAFELALEQARADALVYTARMYALAGKPPPVDAEVSGNTVERR